MKRKITLFALVAGSMFHMNSQVVLNEGFTAPFNLAAAGWGTLNLSSPVGVTSWYQGGGVATFPAYDGAAADFMAANFNNAAAAGGGISSWLISPTVTIYNGAVISFATKCPDNGTSNFRPDRMQLRMSSVTSSAIPSGSTSLGNFTTLLLDINPNLNTSTVSAVNNGSVNGYPKFWTVYTIPITGVTGTVTGRFAFRYFVDNAGNAGTNSNYVGVDRVVYTLPCGPIAPSYTVCPNTNVVINPTGGLPATTYSWDTGANTASILVTPSVTTVYTLSPSNGTILCGNSVTSTITVGAQLSLNLTTTSNNLCSGRSATLTTQSAANSFTWSNGGSTSSIVVTPNSTTTYSVAASNGACFGGNSVLITVIPSPTLSYALSPFPICLGATSMTVTASGANSYTYIFSNSTNTTNPITSIVVPTVTGVFNFGISGTALNGCTSSGTATFAVSDNPTVTVTSTKNVECINRTITLTALGADSYTWSGAATSTSNPITFSTGTQAGNKSFTVVGTNSAGCTHTTIRTVSVSLCTGIVTNFDENVETSVFPNPFTNEIKISGLNGKIEIYNSLGQMIVNSLVSNTETFNTIDLPKGAYLLKAYSKEGTAIKTIKLLKE